MKRIAEVAKIFNVTTRTIRYYEEIGLLKPSRTRSNQRLFSKSDLAKMKLIARGKKYGFSLDEIKDMVLLFDRDRTGQEQLKRTIEYGHERISDIDERIAELTQIKKEMQGLIVDFSRKLKIMRRKVIMNSSNLLQMNATKYPNNEAVVCSGRRVSYEELNKLVNMLSNSLLDNGINKGDKVVLFMPNVLEFVICYFAVQRINAVAVPINAKLSHEEINYILDHSNANAIIAHELLFETAKNIKKVTLAIKTGEEKGPWLSLDTMLKEGSEQEVQCHLTEDDISSMLYTSGTTGKPKGVLFSYRNILTVANMICVEMEMKPKSRVLLMMPLSHSAPLHLFLMGGMVVGATLVLTATFTPDLLVETVEKEKTTHFFGAPVAYLLTAKLPNITDADLSSMKWWVYGGAGLSKHEVEFVQQAFNTDDLVCVYGLTEAGPSGSLLFKEEHKDKPGSIGKRAPLYTELRIIDDHGNDVGVDEIGEIILRGEGNMIGYYNNEAATKEAFFNDWLKTGDLARKDKDGYMYVVDRKDDLIISGGQNIYPTEIEEVILSYPAIHEVAVIGIPSEEWGETVKAVYAGSETIDKEKLKEHIKRHISSYKVPRVYEQIEQLTRNATGKILKNMLRENK